jgi:LPPG:FO 2-phospho-L-lactate transferase
LNITALCGGVGGAKLAFGLNALEIGLRVVVNTGDDFMHYGLTICPDFDTVAYTLSGLANTSQGWGRADESFGVQTALAALDGPPWFTLGDKDIALHLLRAGMLAHGKRLSEIMAEIRGRLQIKCEIWPMSDAVCPTLVETVEGVLPFQEYFVGRRCAPVVKQVHFGGVGQRASPEALASLVGDDVDGIIIVPSNPVLSVAPILAVDELRKALAGRSVPALAVSPLISGAAVKGPTAKIFAEMGLEVTALGVARMYEGLIDIFVMDDADAELCGNIEKLGMKPVLAPIMMRNDEDRVALARFCVQEMRQGLLF